MAEVEKMSLRALNRNKEISNTEFKLVSLNIRSLKKHFVNLNYEPQIKGSDVILVQQTCLGISECIDRYQLAGYMSHFNSYGDGKGIALYHKAEFKQVCDIKKEKYQISKLESEKLDIIAVYRSSDSSKSSMIDFLSDMRTLIFKKKKILILGDFNFNASCQDQNYILRQLENWNFKQLIQNPTHIQGGVIDHCYISNNLPLDSISLSQKSVYYTDHDIIEVTINEK